MSEVKKCPKCGGEMEEGYLYVHDGGRVQIDFTREKPSFAYSGISGDKLFGGGLQLQTTVENEAYRCRKCRLVIFYY